MNSRNKLIFFLIIFILIGMVITFFGFKITMDNYDSIKDYDSVTGYFAGASSFSNDENKGLYKLTYLYTVNGTRYTITTDYGTNNVPHLGDKMVIKYNPVNPYQAVVGGVDYGYNIFLLLFGLVLTIGPAAMLADILYSKFNPKKEKFGTKIINCVVGGIITIIGCWFYSIMCLSSKSCSPVTVFKEDGFLTIIPIMAVLIGIYFIVNSLTHKYPETDSSYEPSKPTINKNKKDLNIKGVDVYSVVNIIYILFKLLSVMIIVAVLGWIFSSSNDVFARILVAPFLLISFCILIIFFTTTIQEIFFVKNSSDDNFHINRRRISKKLSNVRQLFTNIIKIMFLSFWFGFLMFTDYLIIADNQTIQKVIALILTVIFWAIGLYLVYIFFRKKEK